jgi:hypothetical protein
MRYRQLNGPVKAIAMRYVTEVRPCREIANPKANRLLTRYAGIA